nr:MAG TPA: hypothetical protein [Caudoviricetes sp.]
MGTHDRQTGCKSLGLLHNLKQVQPRPPGMTSWFYL